MGGVLLLLLIPCALGVTPTSTWGTGRKAKATQYHTQDPTNGAYQYGYTGPHHAKSESSMNGVTRGGYSYIDANGMMQTVSYTADAENGFRVHASNLPNPNSLTQVEDTPEVALAKKRHLDQLRKAESLAWEQPQREHYQYQIPSQQLDYEQQQQYHQQHQPQYQSQPQQLQSRQDGNVRNPHLLTLEEARSIPAPRPNNAIVVEASKDDPTLLPPRRFSASSSSIHHAHHYMVPVSPTIYAMPMPLIHSSMRHTQDSLGQYEYSYTGDTSAKTESRSLDGTTRGAYSYIDANGLLQQVHYIADRDGFRVLATNLPEA